jgi:hypothetical protein
LYGTAYWGIAFAFYGVDGYIGQATTERIRAFRNARTDRKKGDRRALSD